MALTEPEKSLLADFRVLLCAGHFNQLRDTVFFRELRESEDSFLLHFRVGVILDGIHDGGRGLFAGFLRDPEEGLPADELAARRKTWKMPPYKAERGTLAKYIRSVKSAALGCVTDEE